MSYNVQCPYLWTDMPVDHTGWSNHLSPPKYSWTDEWRADQLTRAHAHHRFTRETARLPVTAACQAKQHTGLYSGVVLLLKPVPTVLLLFVCVLGCWLVAGFQWLGRDFRGGELVYTHTQHRTKSHVVKHTHTYSVWRARTLKSSTSTVYVRASLSRQLLGPSRSTRL